MNSHRLLLASLVLLACSRSPQDAGIVLNVDTDVTSHRTMIKYLAVTVDGRRQDWSLTGPLPGSLGIQTSPGRKSVTVEGFWNPGTLPLGVWSGTIVANKGSVVVQDVHLACVVCAPADAGPGSDASPRADGSPGSPDSSGRDAFGAGGDTGRTGTGGISGQGGASGGVDGGRGGSGGGDAALDARDVPAMADTPVGIDTTPVATAPYTGAFSVASQFNLPATAAAPGPMGDTLRLVHRFVDDPAAAILDFAEDAGVPALSTLRSALPDVLESRLTGWMNSYIKTASVSGVSPYDQLVTLDGIIQSVLLRWRLQSRLYVPVDALGTHAPISLSFSSSLSPVVVPLEPTAGVTSGSGITVTLSWPNGPGGAVVAVISDHAMGLPFGRYALQGLNGILLAEYGTPNLAAYLSNAVGCAGMAKYVASQCVDVVLSTVCVGYESELRSVCEGGLAEGAKQIEDQIRGLDFKAIHFQRGTATAIGATISRPQDATALQGGVWTATVDLSNGPEPANATFTATATN